MNWFSRMLGRPADPGAAASDEPFVVSRGNRNVEQSSKGFPSFRSVFGHRNDASGPNIGVADARAALRDAFTPSQPVNERSMFAGRRELLRDLVVAIEDRRLHFVLYGERGIGKTSILHVLKDLAIDATYQVIYISCSEQISFADFGNRVAQKISLLYHASFPPGSREIEDKRTLADTLPEGPIDGATLGEALGYITGTRLLILLDEFDRAKSDDFRRSIAELIKNLSDRAAPVQIVIAGVADNLTELVAQIPSIRRNVLGVLVPNMSEAEVGEMIDVAEAKAGISFTDDARDLLQLASLGLPYLVGLIGQSAGLAATDDGRLQVGKADVRDAVATARRELASRIDNQTTYTLNQVEASDGLLGYSKLAHIALCSGGLLPPASIGSALNRNVDSGFDGDGLIELVPNDQAGRWQFIDDGAPPLIWLTALSLKQ